MHSVENYLPEATITHNQSIPDLSSSPSCRALPATPLEQPLDAVGQFHLIVDAVPLNSIEEDQDLSDRARAGDAQAREGLLLRTLPYIRQVARKYAKMLPHDAFLDLVSEAVLAVTAKLEQALERSDKPIYYLLSIAGYRIRSYCQAHRSLISSPARHTFRDPVYWTESMDVPLAEDETLTLADTLSQPDLVLEAPKEPDYRQVYRAIEKLTEAQQEAILRHYGLGERAPELFAEMRKTSGLGNVYTIHERALARLCKLLSPGKVPGPVEGGPKKQKRETEEALALAYEQLIAEGAQIGVTKLMSRSGRGRKACRAWLENHHPERLKSCKARKLERAVLRDKKLDAAYQELVAKGKQVTGTRLSEAAHMRKEHAFAWMEQRGLWVRPEATEMMERQEGKPPKPLTAKQQQAKEQRAEEREQRLRQAYAELVAEGTPLSARRLCERAQVAHQTGRLWLKARQAEDGANTPEKLLSSVFPKGLPDGGAAREGHLRDVREEVVAGR
jgi:DNA-directed RNA polymerase specialized sigma24 family protein